jgi:hypothetical protein
MSVRGQSAGRPNLPIGSERSPTLFPQVRALPADYAQVRGAAGRSPAYRPARPPHPCELRICHPLLLSGHTGGTAVKIASTASRVRSSESGHRCE